ncbi:hypothetical protein [Actinocatenispora rupis]|uniref:Uncharacterized protein n=1 Tax=Actinocatenispora rupis TaxID=519421 RepID=A0A8J3J1I8_9ACTN|nr:hypothetical protein [Actinocatenispora rupis]GID14066.1 hypothetical protein Aru02nite_49550 [Actinocatenispora rupis]
MATLGTEIWLHGTKADLAAIRDALAPLGTWLQIGDLHPTELAGHVRVYLRLSVAVQTGTRRTKRSAPAGRPELDLPAA